MKYTLKKATENPFLYSRNNIVAEVNNELINLTGYSKNELTGKSILEIGNMLRINSQVCLEKIENEYSCYMFTKEYELRQVTIFLKKMQSENEKIYFIKEKPNSRIEDELPYVAGLLADNEIGIAIYCIKDGALLKANKKFLDFWDNPYSEKGNTLGRTPEEILSGYKGSDFEKAFLNVIKTHKPYYSKENKHGYFEKGYTYWDVSIVPIYLSGKAKYIIHSATDITEKVLNRKLVEEQKDKLEAIIENMSDFLVIFDKHGNIKKINKAAKSYAWHSEAVGKMNYNFKKGEIFEMDGKSILEENSNFTRILKGERLSRHKVAIKINNDVIYTESSGNPIYDEKGNFIAGVLLTHDITDRVKSEENLLVKTQLDLLNNIIENFEVGFSRCSYPEFKVIDINHKSYEYLQQVNTTGVDLSSIKGKDYFDTFNVNNKVEVTKAIHDLAGKKGGLYFNYIKYIVDGKENFLKVIYQPLYGLNNQVIELMVITIDISEEVKVTKRMEETLKMQEEFFVNISHELKTPLNVIFATGQLLNMYCNSGSLDERKASIIKYVESIKQNSYRLSKLINNIVDLSKIEAGFFELNLSNSNIVEVVEEIVMSVTNFTELKGLNIIFDTDKEEIIIACDEEKIERIVLNLISNAIKFSEVGDEIFVDIKDKNEFIEISVKDNGIGIEENHLDMIFDRFKQVDKSLTKNAEGTGIGLSLVKSIVELHGGRIYVESKFGEGSKFTVVLPNRKVIQENMLFSSKIRTKRENIQVEFSDVRS